MKIIKKQLKGFTLVEMLLYIVISATVLLIISALLHTMLKSRVKNQTIAEVEQQGLQIMQIVTRTIRNAEGIILPIITDSGDSLTLDVVDIVNDPTVFSFSSDIIYITEGSNIAIPLTNSRVIVSNVNFQNLSRVDTSGTVRISFTLTRVNNEGLNEYNFERTFYGSASLRLQ